MEGLDSEEWCQDHVWKGVFKNKSFKTKSIFIPHRFAEYLALDSVVVDRNDSDDEVQKMLRSEDIEGFCAEIESALADFEGKPVVPRLNWSCPKDAEWMHSIDCKTVRDVLLVLKSSVIVSDDLELCQKLGLKPILNLVRFHPLKESMLFRCFVKNKVLVGVSQKDISTAYEHLEQEKELIYTKISEFIEGIKEKCPLADFTIDVYVDLPPKYRIFIMGFDSFIPETDSLLFAWEELERNPNNGIRVCANHSIRASSYSSYRAPIDMQPGTDLSEFINSLSSESKRFNG